MAFPAGAAPASPHAALRRLVAETAIQPQHLVLPLFVREGAGEARAIPSMPGVVQHNRDTVRKSALDAVEAGVGGDAFRRARLPGRRGFGR